MPRSVLDTDHLTLFHHGHPARRTKMVAQPAGTVGLTVITVEEALPGRRATLRQARTGGQRIVRYAQLQETVQLVDSFPIVSFDQAADPTVSFDQAAEDHFQQLRLLRLRSARI